ncbi:hypothetical protein F6X53_19545 [Methylobacterium soli]|uniref:Uncharacterized protein n=1 Tax=Methylobacterium soli TaxID=553447 RepID=A0A6L3SYI3_9HYPH|nr:hypothetical protein F6X53_19545 [Methylobacterium soli]
MPPSEAFRGRASGARDSEPSTRQGPAPPAAPDAGLASGAPPPRRSSVTTLAAPAAGPLSRPGEGQGEGCALSGEVASLTRSARADSTSPERERWGAALRVISSQHAGRPCRGSPLPFGRGLLS